MKKIYVLMFFAFIALSACDKEKNMVAPNFEVTTTKSTYKVGETVVFNLSGNPDIISFYSGEVSSDYNFKGKDRVFDATTALSFQLAKYAGNNPNCAALKYSTDFNGTYDIASIRKATWTDISDRFYISSIESDVPVFKYSGEKDISDIFPDTSTPVYLAWFFTTNQNSNRTRVQMQNFQIRGLVAADDDLSNVKYGFVDCAFKMVQGEGFLTQSSATQYPRVTSTYVYWDGVYANTSFKEGWAITAPLYSAGKLNVGPAVPLGIKAVSDPQLTTYSYIFKEPGTYKVVFVAANSNIYDRKEVVREMEIVIAP